MSLYFEESVEEERIAGDPEKDRITFAFQRDINIPPHNIMHFYNQDFDVGLCIAESFKTIYGVKAVKWSILCTNDILKTHVLEPHFVDVFSAFFNSPSSGKNETKSFQNGSCNISYKLYNALGSEIHSSERISLTHEPDSDSLFTPDQSVMEKLFSSFISPARMVIFVELELFVKFFFRPFEISWIGFNIKHCESYPEDLTTDFRFDFLNESDFTFNCPDGTVPALKMVMNVTSLKKYLNQSSNDEFVLDHAVDVVKPIVTYFHSQCFEMPKTYNLDFADRLLKAIDFFQPEFIEIRNSSEVSDNPMTNVIHYSICEKFVQDPHDFETILKWISIAARYCFDVLEGMIVVVIAEKYFYQFFETFPEETRTAENQMLQDTFGTGKKALQIFKEITIVFQSSFFTKKILS